MTPHVPSSSSALWTDADKAQFCVLSIQRTVLANSQELVVSQKVWQATDKGRAPGETCLKDNFQSGDNVLQSFYYRMVCFQLRFLVCLCVGLFCLFVRSITKGTLLDFHDRLWKGLAWAKEGVITFSSNHKSLSGQTLFISF